MPRLTRKDIADLKSKLAQWQAPEAMSRLVDDTMTWMGAKDLFNQSGLALLRDAWVAAEFGGMRQAEQVRQVADVWPDFELRVKTKVEQFEAVEADDPHRRRGDEFQEGIGEIDDDPVEHWVPRGTGPHMDCVRIPTKKRVFAPLSVELRLSGVAGA